ncbi:MAG TPA: sterol desaturase family protein [bacterium]|nr:sterol desaturase family protein [bacterium]
MVTSSLVRRFRNPWMAMALYVPLGVLIAYLSLWAHPRSFIDAVGLVAIGVFAWTLIEYGLHRFIFHWTDVKEPWRTLASGLHMAHHASADTADLIVAPPVASLGFGTVVYLVFALLSWNLATAALLMDGVFVGYLFYEWVHFMAHRFHPRSRAMKYLRRYHLQHHFRHEAEQFGVTTPLWDWVFGSYRTGPVRHTAATKMGSRP